MTFLRARLSCGKAEVFGQIIEQGIDIIVGNVGPASDHLIDDCGPLLPGSLFPSNYLERVATGAFLLHNGLALTWRQRSLVGGQDDCEIKNAREEHRRNIVS